MRVFRVLFYILLAAAGLSACASGTTTYRHPDFGNDCTRIVPAENVDCVRVYYGTNRQVTTSTALSENTEANIATVAPMDAGTLTLGRADVWLPRLVEKGGRRERGETPLLKGSVKDKDDLVDYVLLTRITAKGRERFLTDLQGSVDATGDDAVLLFIHGFNVEFEPALIRSAQLSVDLGYKGLFSPGVPVLFSWPSAGQMSLDNYKGDREYSAAAAPYLTEFLDLLTRDLDIGRINIIAHSMGNRVLTRAIEDYARAYLEASDKPDVEFRIIMAAADVDRDVFDEAAGVLDLLEPNVTIYTSDRDRALQISKLINKTARLGDTDGDKPYIRDNAHYETVDATAVATELFGLGHGYYSSNPFILGDMICVLTETSPDARSLGRKKYAGDPEGPEFFWANTEMQPFYDVCSLVRGTQPYHLADIEWGLGTMGSGLGMTGAGQGGGGTGQGSILGGVIGGLGGGTKDEDKPQMQPDVILDEDTGTVSLFYRLGESILTPRQMRLLFVPADRQAGLTKVQIDVYASPAELPAGITDLARERAERIREWLVGTEIDEALIEIVIHEDSEGAPAAGGNPAVMRNGNAVVTFTYGE